MGIDKCALVDIHVHNLMTLSSCLLVKKLLNLLPSLISQDFWHFPGRLQASIHQAWALFPDTTSRAVVPRHNSELPLQAKLPLLGVEICRAQWGYKEPWFIHWYEWGKEGWTCMHVSLVIQQCLWWWEQLPAGALDTFLDHGITTKPMKINPLVDMLAKWYKLSVKSKFWGPNVQYGDDH